MSIVHDVYRRILGPGTTRFPTMKGKKQHIGRKPNRQTRKRRAPKGHEPSGKGAGDRRIPDDLAPPPFEVRE